MKHGTIRAAILPDVVKMIGDKFHWSFEETLDRFYTSATGKNFSDDSTGLYGQSALYIFGMFCEEMDGTEES
ncbi:MAG: hypothetical protein NC293_11770 [Roseburia sp.]|nr:hypothetical protein [Roseburia sp.]